MATLDGHTVAVLPGAQNPAFSPIVTVLLGAHQKTIYQEGSSDGYTDGYAAGYAAGEVAGQLTGYGAGLVALRTTIVSPPAGSEIEPDDTITLQVAYEVTGVAIQIALGNDAPIIIYDGAAFIGAYSTSEVDITDGVATIELRRDAGWDQNVSSVTVLAANGNGDTRQTEVGSWLMVVEEVPDLTISNLTPAAGVAAGEPGAFSTVYSIARYTPVEFDLTGLLEGTNVEIIGKFANRSETYVVLDNGAWRWPFDAYSSIGALDSEPVHVSILPRGGWPPVPFEFRVARATPAVVP